MCECVWSELKIASSATNPGSYCYLLTNNIPLSLISGLWVRTSGAGCFTEHNTHQSVPGPAQVSVGLHTSRRVSQTFPTSCGGVLVHTVSLICKGRSSSDGKHQTESGGPFRTLCTFVEVELARLFKQYVQIGLLQNPIDIETASPTTRCKLQKTKCSPLSRAPSA